MLGAWLLATPTPNPLQVACKECGFERWHVEEFPRSRAAYRKLEGYGLCKVSLLYGLRNRNQLYIKLDLLECMLFLQPVELRTGTVESVSKFSVEGSWVKV